LIGPQTPLSQRLPWLSTILSYAYVFRKKGGIITFVKNAEQATGRLLREPR